MTRVPAFILFFLLALPGISPRRAAGQTNAPTPAEQPVSPGVAGQMPVAPPIPADAPHMTRETRLQIIRDFEMQLVYSRTAFPMGLKGLRLKDGTTTPGGEELRQALTIYGPAIKPGDPAHISFVRIRNDHIHFEVNGGPVRRKKWYQHIEVSGSQGPVATGPNPNEVINNPHGSFVDLYFDNYVPELSPQQLRSLLFPVLDFNARSKEQAYLDTVPPQVKEAILKHHILVGMNEEMVIHAKGRPPKKVREREGETDYEEWIYGDPPQDVDFVRLVGDEVVRVETMRVDGQKIVRTEKEVILEPQDKDKDKEAKQEDPDVRPHGAPSMRRPGEDSEEAPRPADGPGAPLPPPVMPPPPSPGSSGPGSIVSGTR